MRLTEAEFTTLLSRIHDVIMEMDAAHDEEDPARRVWVLALMAADDTL